jgi:murein DD-endopeptidase MepM/ murein hydrolase activator NlpD
MQGFHGPWSHKELSPTLDLTYAVDSVLPLGTPVLAVKGGEVLMIYDQSAYCYDGVDPNVGNKLHFGMTNFIFIQHEDGAVSVYSHLEKGSALVATRQKILCGQQIARTGMSGWVGPTPHLHLHLFKREVRKSFPFTFKGYDGPLEHSELFK